MRTKFGLILFFIVLVATVTSANADIFITLDLTNPSQPNNDDVVSVSFSVHASSDANPSVLTVAGGYSLSCQGGLNNPRPGLQSNPFSNPGGATKKVTVSDNHAIAGYSDWTDGTDHLCTVDYMGRAAEGATGTSGTGFSFVFQVGSLFQKASTSSNSFQMQKYADGTPGDPRCTVEQ